MVSENLLSHLFVGLGALFLLSSIIYAWRLKHQLPPVIRNKWMQLVALMFFFFCGHLFFAYLLLHDAPFPRIIISASIFFGGTFALFLVSHTKTAATVLSDNRHQLHKVREILKNKDNMLTLEIAASRESKNQLQHSANLFLKDLFEMMTEVLANRDQYTFDHALHVADISKRIGTVLKLSQEELDVLELGCLVHDIGKTAIPDDVLLKPDRFDNQDRNIMDYHPLIGAKLLSRHIKDDRITDIILQHHERLDGTGSPQGLKAEELGLLPRIVAVADTYDALVSRRPYKTAMTRKEALTLMEREAVKGHLDRRIVGVLKKVSRDIRSFDSDKKVTAGFMKNIELFRRRSYFREPLTDFYNYRYLLSLDDAGLLQKNTLPYEMILIRFPNFSDLQLDIGYAVADQILDELGHNLLHIAQQCGARREFYEGSIMFFRKGIDYLFYAEYESEELSIRLHEQIRSELQQYDKDWNLHNRIYRQQFGPGFPVIQAICRLFDQTTRLGPVFKESLSLDHPDGKILCHSQNF